jgi:triphosphatase
MEIELKLEVKQNALACLESEFLPTLNAQIHRSEKAVFNEYYDTPEQLLGKRKMGFRVRTANGGFEQTVKTQGQVQGGLHQRPEYNIRLSSPQPDLTKFNPDIWGDDFDVQTVNRQIEKLFTTQFQRTQFDIKTDKGLVELVLDIGEVKTDDASIAIHEIELELKQGEPSQLFDIAEGIAKLMPVRLSNTTKAERGYQLIQGGRTIIPTLPQFLPLKSDDTTQAGLCKAIDYALSHWQYHQGLYLQTEEPKALTQVRISLLLLMQSVSLYLPVLRSDRLQSLHKQLLILVQQWSWQEDLISIHHLRSRKGPFCKRVPKNPQIINYLLGRREGLFQAYKPRELLLSKLSSTVQLSASRILVEKPWREQSKEADIALGKHANGWLSKSWQTVMQSLPSAGKMDAGKYLAIEGLLKQSLTNGFLLGDLFAESRGDFRAPWLDLLQGIEELKALSFLQDAAAECEIDDALEFQQWMEGKTQNLLDVMERSREIAMQADVYW